MRTVLPVKPIPLNAGLGATLVPQMKCVAGALRSHHAQTRTNNFIQSLQPSQEGYDIILSSGFLAFAAHAGFLQAVEDLNLPVRGVMGTSSGALTGALYAAGYSPREIAHELGKVPPIQRIRMSRRPWRGVLSLDPAMKELRALLPPRFENLERDFAVGVVGRGSQSLDDPQPYHELIDSGLLAESIVASAAVPVLFSPVDIPGGNNGPYMDGGVACRIGLDIWRRHRQHQRHQPSNDDVRPALVHLIGRSSPFSGNDSLGTLGKNVAVVCSPKSRASLWNLNGYDLQFEAARERALEVLTPLADVKKTTAVAS
ncbi:hypothetical protein Ndes2526B_g00851 [Nannochloris sp. 'desiccata']